MHEKGRMLIKKAMKVGKLSGLDSDCNYLPCHDAIQDCTFCYCPFYPCNDPDVGGREIISSRTGQSVWSCSQCTFNHEAKNAEKILDGLIKLNEDFNLISRKELLSLKKRIIEGW
ncbi:MAG: hypothetical protein JW891_02575 [Candidatus Lokiarchaeota archaeon]|nr:hypothetical protein [Candidatus Lokiarchaeota archaeon]